MPCYLIVNHKQKGKVRIKGVSVCNMKSLKYYLVILLSVAATASPLLGIVFWYMNRSDNIGLIGGVIIAVGGLILAKPLTDMRVELRKYVEYDEFGRSKKKGTYERLSKKERDQIDLQKTMDMERVMDSTAMAKMTKKGSENPDADMDNLIGLSPVKQKMREMVARMQFEAEANKGKKKKDRTNSMSGRHMVFYGSPGTGKTTVARILTGFLYQYGYISENKCVEIDGNFLKAGTDSALKTELTIRQAYGGVLFIDEAYALIESGDGSGEQAVATLIKQMEDNRDKFILILAGYTNEMKMLLDLNPGFESRIKEYLDFPDYNDDEIAEIFSSMAQSEGYSVSEDALCNLMDRIEKERNLRSFGNARTARNILDEALDKHALNYIDRKISQDDKYRLRGADISVNLKREHF